MTMKEVKFLRKINLKNIIMVVKVKNLHNTGDRKPVGYNSWLEYWEAKSGEKATECNSVTCSAKTDLVGAHVIKAGSLDGKWYIIPLCKACNKRNDEFYVSGTLVAVN